MALDGNLDLLSFNSQRQTSLSPNFKTRGYGFTNVDKSLIPSLPLADAAWNQRAFGYPNTILITINCYYDFHIY